MYNFLNTVCSLYIFDKLNYRKDKYDKYFILNVGIVIKTLPVLTYSCLFLFFIFERSCKLCDVKNYNYS